MPYIYNGQAINGQITIGSVQFPSGWNFTLNPVEGVTWQEPEPIPDSVPEIPQVLTQEQAYLILLQYGLLDEIEAFVATQDRVTQIRFKSAAIFKRTDPLLVAVALAKGLTEAQLDEMFTQGSLL